MAKVKIQGNASGTGVLTVTAPNTSTDRTITLPDGTGTLIADNGSGKVGIGTSSPDGTAHIHTASAGSVTANADADDLVVENSGHTGINILSPNASRSAIQLGHTSDNLKMQIRHDGATSLTQIISDDPVTFNVTDGSESIRVTADGITFQGDTAAANALDDYEEGTWTPTWTSEGGTVNTNTSYTRGTYTKVGRQVTVYARLYTNSVSSPTGYIQINGLPFTVEGTNDTQGAYEIMRIGALTGTLSGVPVLTPNGGQTTCKVVDKQWNSTQVSGDIADHFDNDVWGHMRLTYFV